MVRVKGTKGNVVQFDIKGISSVVKQLNAANHKIEFGADFGVVRAATFITEEVQESIAGNRVETKSVDTGALVKSIDVAKLGKAKAKVYPKKDVYKNSNTNTQMVAFILEHGSSKILPRRHFKNTEIKDIIDDEVKQKLAT